MNAVGRRTTCVEAARGQAPARSRAWCGRSRPDDRRPAPVAPRRRRSGVTPARAGGGDERAVAGGRRRSRRRAGRGRACRGRWRARGRRPRRRLPRARGSSRGRRRRPRRRGRPGRPHRAGWRLSARTATPAAREAGGPSGRPSAPAVAPTTRAFIVTADDPLWRAAREQSFARQRRPGPASVAGGGRAARRQAPDAILASSASPPVFDMHLRGIGTATPPARYTKAECLEAFHRSEWFARLDTRSHLIARTVLQRDNGIEARRLALASLDEVFTIDPDTLDRRFLANAPLLARERERRRWPRPASTRPNRCRRRQHLHRLPVPGPVRLRGREARAARRRAGLRPGRPGLRRGLAEPAARRARCWPRAPRSTCCRCASR